VSQLPPARSGASGEPFSRRTTSFRHPASSFEEIAQGVVRELDPVEMGAVLARRAVVLFGLIGAGFLLTGGETEANAPRPLAASSEETRLLQQLETETGEGPGVGACRSGLPVVVADLEAQAGWPRFRVAALASRVRSAVALPMRVGGAVLGALELYGHQPFLQEGVELVSAQALADLSGIALSETRHAVQAEQVATQLRHALASRITIEQAKGMLAARLHIDVSAAFDALRNFARAHGRRVREVAADVVSGTLTVEDVVKRPQP
jgi:GAF domain-containing protein